jgi:hypothetical protein
MNTYICLTFIKSQISLKDKGRLINNGNKWTQTHMGQQTTIYNLLHATNCATPFSIQSQIQTYYRRRFSFEVSHKKPEFFYIKCEVQRSYYAPPDIALPRIRIVKAKPKIVTKMAQ